MTATNESRLQITGNGIAQNYIVGQFVTPNGGHAYQDMDFYTNPSSGLPFLRGRSDNHAQFLTDAYLSNATSLYGLSSTGSPLSITEVDSSNNLQFGLNTPNEIVLGYNTTSGKFGAVIPSSGGVQMAPYTVSTLPPCSAQATGTLAYVTDATSPSYNGTLTGGGAVKALALCNGSTWTAH